MDPLSISSGLGTGYAQVFKPSVTMAEGLEYTLQERRRKEKEAAAQAAAKQKAVTDIYDTVEEVNVTGYLPHVNYLTKQKDDIRNYLTDQLVKTKGKYNPAGDPVVGKLVSGLKKENQMSTQIKEYAKTLPTMLTKENSKNYTDESILEIDKFLKLPLSSQVKYVEDRGSYPLPAPKPEMIDYDKNIDDLAKGLSEKSTTTEKLKPEGGTEIVTTGGYDPKNVELYAKSYVVAGLEGRKPDAANLLQTTRKKLEGDIVFQAMAPEDQDKKVMQKAEEYVTKRLFAGEKKGYSQTLQGEGKGLIMNFGGGGNSAENDQVRVVVSDTLEKRVYNIAQIKGTENSVMNFSMPDGSVIKGTPLRIEKSKSTGGMDVVVSVPETVKQTTGSGSKKVTRDIPSGKVVEKKVPYKMNEDRIFKGKFKFTIDDIDSGLQEQGVQVKSGDQKSAKTVTQAKIKALVGTKGYEGYTEQELVDYYKSQGYMVQ